LDIEWLSGNGLAITYTAFNKPETITRGSDQIGFAHDSEHQRFKQITASGETLYLNAGGVMAERLAGAGGVVQWTDYLFAGGEMIGMRVEHSVSGIYTRYFHKDHLGSIATITDEAGIVVERLSYDAWGKRRSPDGTDDPTGSITSQTTRGFTGHEQLTEVGLVHMNGRVYDPLLGRFGTPDPMTESPYSTQGWNRYAYVGNSPLNFTDPSGFCFAGCFWQAPFKALGGALRRTPILGNILQVAGAVICGPGAFVCVGIVSATITGLASGDLGQWSH
jgi:RHS repeat-associated protein